MYSQERPTLINPQLRRPGSYAAKRMQAKRSSMRRPEITTCVREGNRAVPALPMYKSHRTQQEGQSDEA